MAIRIQKRRSHPGLTVALAVTLALGLIVAPGAHAATVIDQQQPTIDMAVGGLAIGGPSEQKLAQVVTAGVPGYLTSVRLPVACDSGSLITQIQAVTEGVPNGTIRATSTMSAESLAGRATDFKDIPFSNPTSVAVGEQFALVLDSTGACGIFQGPLGNPYPRGSGYFDARPNATGWVVQSERNDLPFRTLVSETPTPIGPPPPEPSQSPTPQPSQSAPAPEPSSSGTPSTGESPTPSQTPSTEASPTGSPVPTPTTPPIPEDILTLRTSTTDATSGDVITLTGQVGDECASGEYVNLLRRLPGQALFQPFTISEVGEENSFEEPLVARKTAVFKAASAACQSEPVAVKVRKRVTAEVSKAIATVGEEVKVLVRLAPCRGYAGDPVSLFIDDDEGRFILADRKLTSDTCQATFSQIVLRDTYFLVKAPRTDDLLARGLSKAVGVFVGEQP